MLRWLAPGLGVKRWFFLLLLGVTLLGVGLAYFLLDFYRTSISDDLLPVLDVATLRFLPRLMRVVIFGGLGVSMISLGDLGFKIVPCSTRSCAPARGLLTRSPNFAAVSVAPKLSHLVADMACPRCCVV